ncbi:MAG TPA: tripartite tricarboxylate transporter substrate binding protein [Burkholderiales bacterium]|nr:tripartite tricarboxylate transporter substrate binding protein [Burkholderiales bacterium]
MKQLVGFLLAASALLAAGGEAAQSSYPDKPIRILVGFPPGQASDVLARLVAQRLSEAWGQQVVVDNRPGAGGSIAPEIAARATADGHTVLLTSSAAFSINPHLYRKPTFDPLKDFTPVTNLVRLPYVLYVSPTFQARNLNEWLALMRAKGPDFNYGSSGAGSTSHLVTEKLLTMAGVKVSHIPYKGSVPVLTDVLAGQIHWAIETTLFALPHLHSGKIRGIAVTSAARTSLLPDLPAAAEAVPGYDGIAWIGIVAPAATPRAIVDKLNAEIVRYMQSRETVDKMAVLGTEVFTTTPAQFDTFLRNEFVKWGKVVAATGVRLD